MTRIYHWFGLVVGVLGLYRAIQGEFVARSVFGLTVDAQFFALAVGHILGCALTYFGGDIGEIHTKAIRAFREGWNKGKADHEQGSDSSNRRMK